MKSVSDMTCLVSSGRLHLNSINQLENWCPHDLFVASHVVDKETMTLLVAAGASSVPQ